MAAEPGPAPEAFYECGHPRCAEECSFPAGDLRWSAKGRGAGWWCGACRERAGGSQDGPTLAAALAQRELDPEAIAERLAFVDQHLPDGLRIRDALLDALDG